MSFQLLNLCNRGIVIFMLFLFFKHDWFNYILSWLLTLTSAFNAHLGIAFHSHNQAAVLLLLFGEPKEILLLLIMFSYTETSLNHIMLIIMILVIKSSDILNYESEKMYLRHTVFCLHLYYRVETIKGFFKKKLNTKLVNQLYHEDSFALSWSSFHEHHPSFAPDLFHHLNSLN